MPTHEIRIDLPGRVTALVDTTPTGGTATRLQAVYAAIARLDRADRHTRIRRTARYGRPRVYPGLAEQRERAEAAQARTRQEAMERGRGEGVSAYYTLTGHGPAQPSAMDDHNARTRARAAALVAAEAGPVADEPRYVM